MQSSLSQRMLGIVIFFITGRGVAFADEVQALIVKAENGTVTFRKAEKMKLLPGVVNQVLPRSHTELLDQLAGTRGATGSLVLLPNNPLMSLPVVKDSKIQARWLNPKTRKVDARELIDGLQNDNLRFIDRAGLPATIVTDEAGTNIKELYITLRPAAPSGPPANLERPGPIDEAAPDPLPVGAVARLGSTRFRHLSGIAISAHALSRDGRLLAVGSLSLQLMDARSGKTLLEVPSDPGGKLGFYLGLAFSEDSNTLACSFSSRTGSSQLVRLVRVTDGKTVTEWSLPAKIVRGLKPLAFLAFLPGDKQLVVEESFHKVVYILDAMSGAVVHTFNDVRAPALSEDGQTLAAIQAADSLICLWDTTTGKERRRLDQSQQGRAVALALSPDGSILAAALGQALDGAKGGSRFALWDVASGKLIRSLADPASWASSPKGYHSLAVQCFCFAPDGKQVAACLGANIVIWDSASGKELRRFPHHRLLSALPKKINFLPDSKMLLLVEDFGVSLLDAANGQPLQLEGHKNPVEAITYSADGRYLATGEGTDGGYLATGGGDVRVWDARSHRLLWKSPPSVRLASVHGVSSLAFNPQGNVLAAAHGPIEDKVLLWDLDSGMQRMALTGFAQVQIALTWHYLRDRFCKVDSSAIRRRSFGANITRCKLEG